MSADRFESRVADWLEDGPEVAPAAITEAALVHASAHPRSRRRTVVLRARRFAPALAAAVLVVAVVGTGVVAFPRFLSPVTSIAPESVGGTETCVTRVDGVVMSPQAGSGDANELRGRIDSCRQSTSDERVDGELTRRIDGWLFGDQSGPTGSSTDFGRSELRNSGGAWTGAFVATYSGRTGSAVPGRLTWIGLGSGDYAGLVYRATVITNAAGEITLTGTIEPITEDAVIATAWCWVDSATPDLAYGSVPHREAQRSCLITADDERVAGTAAEHRVIDVASDGTTADSGTLTVTTAGGGWRGSFSGTGDWYVPGLVSGDLEGFGALAGLRLSLRIVSEDGMHGVLVGTIAPSS
jgi:hypothetical protein